jgi:hypothetical protein
MTPVPGAPAPPPSAAAGGQREPRAQPQPRRDVPVEQYAAWGSDCGDMYFYPEGAINLLFSPAAKNFSVKMKYMGFAPDGYCKRVNACSVEGA